MQFKEAITAFILTKNSEKTIERTLKSLVPLQCGIVILDTGSTDKTVQCCLQYGCTVWYDSWKDNFSLARNTAIAYCSTPWLLMIDSDEELSFFDKYFFELHHQNQTIGGFSLTIKNYLNDSLTSFSKHTYTRIFRNNKLIRFEGKIHEQILPSILNAGYSIIDSAMEITHYGYMENSEEKRERNRQLLENEYAQSTDDYIAYQLVLTYFADKNMDLVISIGTKLLTSVELTTKQIELITIRIAQALLHQSKYEEMKHILSKTFSDREYEFFQKYLLVVWNMQVHNFIEAKTQLADLLSNFQEGMVSLEDLQKLHEVLKHV